jgi:hypothetical protein
MVRGTGQRNKFAQFIYVLLIIIYVVKLETLKVRSRETQPRDTT